MATISDYDDLDATDLARLVKTGSVNPEELLEIAIAKVEQHSWSKPGLGTIESSR